VQNDTKRPKQDSENNDIQNITQKVKDRETLKYGGFTQVLLNSKQFLLHTWDPSCYSGYSSLFSIIFTLLKNGRFQ
jgi:hypothetical protein